MTTRIIDGLDLNSQQIKHVADGSALDDAATWGQVQAFLAGLAWKPSVRAASTTNVSLTSPGASMDGVTLAANDRVLLKNQTTAADNGIYVWTASGSTLTRATDANTAAELKAATVLVTEGTTLADTAWTQTADNVTLGSTSLTFVQFGAGGGGGTYTAGNGLQLISTAFSVKLPGSSGLTADGTGLYVDLTIVTRKYAVAIGNGALTTIDVTHSLNTLDITYQVWEVSTGDAVLIKGTKTDANTLRFVFPSAPTTGQYRVVVHG